ncbi:hypothetical protein M231_01258 [Tremella mesenterica]|uniref:Uncharacterized protein n=1 Tax=Tremella mesenterica TaxID=5217 RepID=A0A4Q1BTF3_TREME|nr:hypothetical protein M231_01258 [Tremella mesenterica]
MSKYVPPSRRPGYVPTSSDLPPAPRQPRQNRPDGPTYHMSDIEATFGSPQDSTLTFFSYPCPIRKFRPREPYDPSRTPYNTPLPPSPPPLPPPHPLRHLLCWITIFPDAHPAWQEKRELWTHTNAAKMIEDWNGEKKNFAFISSTHFFFGGWWIIQDLQIVEPQTDELRDMLQRKEAARSYSRSGRLAIAWQESLTQRWVRLRLMPAPPGQYGELRNPMELSRGEIAIRYLLEVGGLAKEQEFLGEVGAVLRELAAETT